ncbi:B12-binding domain-containing radical SAM protein [Breznakiella homolactica]|uniref:DUF4080 domain-containing protein n=1 Tax=Breznakiella homolactica TaxID=2798577 RepID=A0A7T7XPE4_9SPIR|nr:radical SAM protein [Breznakiella homolactica]QQO10075.1 DUF4080 domain-containing protein [Breznakiella homolactica]
MADIVLAAINAKWIHPSLALRLLKANLRELEDRTEILEFALRQPLDEKVLPILSASPKILGLSVYIWNHRATLELLEALAAAWEAEGRERPLIVLGGPEAAYLSADSGLAAAADWIFRGEGEHGFRDLCRSFLGGPEKSGASGKSAGFALSPHIKAIDGKFIETHPADPASADPGYRLYTGEDLARKLTYVEASRGCPFGCEFCLSSLDRSVRDFPLDGFLTEMDGLIRRGGRSFKFLDRTFNLDTDRARRVMEFFLDRLTPGMFVHFEMVPSRFPRELRELLTRFPAGSLRLEVGIQTFNPETARAIGRPSSPELELENFEFLRNNTAAIVHADLIAGLPGEDFVSFAEGFDRLWMVRPTEIQLGILKLLPGTPLARHTVPFGMVYSPEPPYEVIETAALPRKDLDRIKNFARFWELIVNRGHFEDLGSRLFPEGRRIFGDFMNLSDRLLARFGKNWGIDRAALRAALEEEAALRAP